MMGVHHFYVSPNIAMVIKSRTVKGAMCVACVRQVRNAYKILIGKPIEQRPLGRRSCRWGIISEWILRK